MVAPLNCASVLNHLTVRQSHPIPKLTSLLPCKGANRTGPLMTHRGKQWLYPGPNAARWSYARTELRQWLYPARHQWAAPGPRQCMSKAPSTCITCFGVGQGISDTA